MYLEQINKPSDLNALSIKEKKILSQEIRNFLIDKVSMCGGHLASNLGVVELTIALLSSFDLEKDKIIFDVGHQSYVYKILTGRKTEFDKLRKYKGLRGFPYRKESKYDIFETGHSSTSISAGLGIARARDLKKENFNVVSVIGDGSISNGMSLEGINDLGYNKTKMIIVLNDNGMSISTNVGGLSSYLSRISINEKYLKAKNKVKHCIDGTKLGNVYTKFLSRVKDGLRTFLVPSQYFESMGLTYIGPIDGHDITLMTKVFKRAKNTDKPVIVHVVTKKGKGFEKAIKNPDIYHSVSPFDKDKGVLLKKDETYSKAFGKALLKIAEKNEKVVAITAAMKDGVGLSEFFKKYPKRSFDVGISEEHAVTFAAGLANEKMLPVLAIYSTFLQRSFDQILHDVCMQKLHVIFAIDRTGLVGDDGETHQGIFDISYLSLMPNIIIVSPKCLKEVEKYLKWAILRKEPIAIKYPKGKDYFALKPISKITLGKWETICEGSKIAIISTGRIIQKAMEANQKYNLNVTIINANFIKPIDKNMLTWLVKNDYDIITLEENILNGGLGSLILMELNKISFQRKIICMGFDDKFIEQGSIDELLEQEGLTIEKIKENVEMLSRTRM